MKSPSILLLIIVSILFLLESGQRAIDPRKEIRTIPIDPSVYVYKVFETSCAWYQDISKMEVDPDSDSIIYNTVHIMTDSIFWHGTLGTVGAWPVNYGKNIPLVDKINFMEGYNCREDYPALIPDFERGWGMQNGSYDPLHIKDHHLILLDTGTKKLYEFYQLRRMAPGVSFCEGGVEWDTRKCDQREAGTTSADAAGLPLMPFLITPAEMRRGEINHALRITVAGTKREYISPATHQACFEEHKGKYMPMGTRLRLKACFDTSRFDGNRRIILRCLMKYGAIVADNGNNFSITYVMDPAMLALGENAYNSISLSVDDKTDFHVTAFDLEVMKIGATSNNNRKPCNSPH